MAKLRPSKTSVKKILRQNPIIVRKVRGIKADVRLALYVRAGGRCEYDGCNEYLLRHHVTRTDGNYAEAAHIVAFNEAGPRGKHESRSALTDINNLDNLMLLCPKCHKLVDAESDKHSVEGLRKYKERHEERIFHLTGLDKEHETTILQLKAKINGQPVSIPAGNIYEAVSPLYPKNPRGFVIDLTELACDDDDFIRAAVKTIRTRVEQLYDQEKPTTISVFGMAPIPLLMFLGKMLSNKLEVNFYQFHRDTKNWSWKSVGNPVEYRIVTRQKGSDQTHVALMLSLSGTIDIASLPVHGNPSYYIYEITLADRTPDPTFLNTKVDLDNFKRIYEQFLAEVLARHGAIKEIHVFPAIPAPVAMVCGHIPLPKVHPALSVYDFDKAKEGFNHILRIN